ncbi:MAG: LD-carboxypeptidase [Chitinophagales bacterium]|nr:LD-carboxypeptidase [Chitinophagales bacterium]
MQTVLTVERRKFFSISSRAALAGLSASVLSAFRPVKGRKTVMSLVRPDRLRVGARVALIAPASPVTEEKITKALGNLAMLGYAVQEGKFLRVHNGHLAGTDAQRLEDLHWAFSDPLIDAVWCVRGGYGCTRLLPMIDYALIRKNPKPFIGFSDVTALHHAFLQRSGLSTYHGPVAGGDFPEATLRHFNAIVSEVSAAYTVPLIKSGEDGTGEVFQSFVITPGKAQGALTGGNLALLAAMTGTPFQPVFKDKLVFMEDIDESPYRIDRMLTQLLQGTDLREAAGIALGVFAGCSPKPGMLSMSLQDTLRDRLGALGIPVVYGFPFGHVAHQMTFPMGVLGEMDSTAGTLTIFNT